MKKACIWGLLIISHLLSGPLHSEAEHDDSAINAATSTINAEASRVRAAASSARQQASQLTQTASSVRSAASNARSKAVEMRSQVIEVNSSTMTANANKQRMSSEEISANAEHVRNRADIERLKKYYEPLVQETYNVEQQQKFIDQAQQDLDTFTNFLGKYYGAHDQLPVYISEALLLAKESDVAHQSWMTALGALIEDKKPDFDSIVNFSTMSEEVQKIVSFENSTPNEDALRKLEERAKTNLQIARDRTKSVKLDNFNLVSMRGLHITLQGTDFKSRLQEFYAIERNLQESLRQVNALYFLIEQKQERRNYLVRMIPIVWNRIANLRLQAANVGEGASIIQEIDASLRGPQMLSTIKARTTIFKNEIDQQLRYNFAPYAAYQAVLGAYKNFQDIDKYLNTINLTSNLKIELSALLKDEKAAVDTRSKEITLILSGRDFSKYLSEWKRQARLITGRNQHKLNAACRDLMNEIHAASDFNKGLEQTFLNFKGACS